MVNDHGVFYHIIDQSFTGNRIVKVFVSDQSGFSDPDQGSFRWQLTVLSSVTLADFVAVFEEVDMQVKVRWSTSHEIDNLGFDVFRSHSMNGPFTRISPDFIPSEESGDYLFIDNNVQAGRSYYYKLISLDTRDHEREYGPIKVKIPVPDRFTLSQNYPNPFNPITKIRYQVPRKEHISLMVFNMMGQHVATLVDEETEPGYYTAEWDGRDFSGREASTGIYVYRLLSSDQTITKRMVKMR